MQRDGPRGYYLEDLAEGDAFDCGGITITDESVIRFATEWDMQPFHIDRETASDTLFGGLVGSGLQSIMLCYRLYLQRGLLAGTAMAGLGFDEIRFHNPLRPGTTFRVSAVVERLRRSSRPDRGVLTWRLAGTAADLPVVSMKLSLLIARDPAKA